MYRYEAISIEGFVQQLAVAYVGHGYFFYVQGTIPEGKDPHRVDEKLLTRYGICLSKWSRARRKKGGAANVHYLRIERHFVLIATRGTHRFFEEEGAFRDIRKTPLKFAGYSISYRRGADGKWHPSVRMALDQYRELKVYFVEMATHRSVEWFAREFRRLPIEPYAPVRRQLLNILRAVNRERAAAGFEVVPTTALRLRRRPVKPFESGVALDLAARASAHFGAASTREDPS